MIHRRRSSAALIVVGLAVASLLVIAALELIVIIQRKLPTLAAAATTPGPMIAVLPITAVPTVPHGSSGDLTLLPTLTATPRIDSAPPTPVPMPAQPEVPASIPGPLTPASLDPHAGPVNVPLEIRIPSLKVEAPVVGVGVTLTGAMAAPIGSPDDPIWQTVFWYRGGAIPGDVGTATLAGHVDDSLGRPAVFAHLNQIQPGDLIVVHDTQSGVDVPFIVAETRSYSDQQAADPSVLARVFGSAAVSGEATQSVSDGLAHLTLITCTGAWFDGSFGLRLVVYAIRASYPSLLEG